MACYRSGGCGPYEMRSCSECPASKPEYLNRDKPVHYTILNLDDGQKYAVVYNHTTGITSVRHVVVVHDEYDEQSFVKWYYDHYHKFEGDQFHLCNSTKEMHKFVEQVNEERKALEAEKAKAARKKCKFCAHGNCLMLPNKPGIFVQCNIGSVLRRTPKIMDADDVCKDWRDEDEEDND